ncbi:unnamed protein product [Chrysodeixis includens]|uniref:Uncharacterized protein n=1 Tax=Chrysodeixis includens TaxID=689277 RepID=A0A9P0C341_CHRIL|nr:unnamed protein product [Chrysodeixis includens]
MFLLILDLVSFTLSFKALKHRFRLYLPTYLFFFTNIAFLFSRGISSRGRGISGGGNDKEDFLTWVSNVFVSTFFRETFFAIVFVEIDFTGILMGSDFLIGSGFFIGFGFLMTLGFLMGFDCLIGGFLVTSGFVMILFSGFLISTNLSNDFSLEIEGLVVSFTLLL